MEREKARKEFKEAAYGKLKRYRDRMGDHLLKHGEKLEGDIKEAVKRLGRQMEETGKEYISFMYIGLLKTDLIQGKYRFYLHAMNLQWYLDEEPLETCIEAEELLKPLDELWQELKEEGSLYKGWITRYDIQNIIFDELKAVDASIAQILRYRLRDWEKKGIFEGLTLTPYWFLKWGEYRDQTEFILHTDRTPKESHVWKEETRKARHKPETLVFGYWYRGSCKEDRLKELDMRFSVFEECSLENVAFHDCNMEGSRFTGSRLSGCSFEGSNLTGADFTGCTLEQADFRDAVLEGALFRAESVPFLNLEPEQLQMILLTREED